MVGTFTVVSLESSCKSGREGLGGGGLLGRFAAGMLIGRLIPLGFLIEPKLGMFGRWVTLLPRMLCALITTGFASDTVTTLAVGIAMDDCGIGFEISIVLKEFLSKTFVAFTTFLGAALCVFKNDAIRLRALLFSFTGLTSGGIVAIVMVSGLERGREGAGLAGTFGTCFKGESNSLAVQVEFSKIGDEMIGRGFAPGFNGGKAGGDSTFCNLVEFERTTGLLKTPAVVLDRFTTGVFTTG